MRLSQAQFSDAIRAAGNAMGVPNRCTKRLVQKWETGEHVTCSADYLRVLQAVTGLSVRELGFQSQFVRDGTPAAESSAAVSDGSAVSSGAPTSLQQLANVDADVSMERLRHALEHPSTVDSRTAELVEIATARLFDLEHHSQARLLAPTVDQHLARVTALLTAARHEVVRRRLTVSAGYGALLGGWLAFDRGDTASAHRFWNASTGAAEGTADVELFAASLVFQSYAAARRGDPGTAWQLAHAGALHARSDPRADAWATSRVAFYAAQLGESEAAEQAMKRSLETGESLPDPKPGSGDQPWTRPFNRARVLSSAALTAALLDHPGAIDYATRAVDALTAARVKSRAIVLAEAALTAAILGEVDLCLRYGSVAAKLTHDMGVSIAADLLHDVVPHVLPMSDTRAVRELLPHLTRLPRTADMEAAADEEHEQSSSP
jgi:hypothetical protein